MSINPELMKNVNAELTDAFTGKIEKVPLLALYPEYDKGKILNEYLKDNNGFNNSKT